MKGGRDILHKFSCGYWERRVQHFVLMCFHLKIHSLYFFLHSLAKLRQQIQFMYMWAPKVLC